MLWTNTNTVMVFHNDVFYSLDRTVYCLVIYYLANVRDIIYYIDLKGPKTKLSSELPKSL